MSHRIIVCWSVPRSVSTSFERMVSERGDFTVFDEPFSRSYYFGPDRVSPRYTDTIPGTGYAETIAALEEAALEGPVFVKDLAYQAAPVLGPDLLARVDSCFLVRDPAATLRSLARTWPDYTDEETGWARLGEAADLVEGLGRPLVVLDADQLCADPDGIVRAWCDQMDVEHRPDALTWEAGMRPEWELWGEEWHASTARATGFGPLKAPPPAPDGSDPRLLAAYEEALPVYERLRAVSLGG